MGQQSSKGRTAPVRADLVRESKIGFGSLKRERSPVTVNQQRRLINGRNSVKSRTINNDTKKACTLDLSPLNLDKSPTPTRKLPSTRRATALNNACNNSEKQLQNGSTLVAKDRGTKEIRASSINSTTRIPIEFRHQEAQTEDYSIDCDLNQSKCAQDTIQALCLTIQYLTRQLDECSTQAQNDLRHLTMARVNLEEKLKEERDNHQKALKELSTQLETSHAARVKELENALKHERNEFDKRLQLSLDKLNEEHKTSVERLKNEYTTELQSKEHQWNDKYAALSTKENQNDYKTICDDYESLKLSLKPIFTMKNRVIAKLKKDISNLQRQVEDKNKLQKQIDDMKRQLKRNNEIKDDIINNDSSESSEIIDYTTLSGNDQIATLSAEIWSLRSVLEIRSQENSTMRSENEILRRNCEGKEQLEQRVESLEARCEDLKAQLQTKESYERQLSHQNEILLGSFHEISKHNKRLTQRNEELQWRLRQKNEVVSVLANQLATPPPRLSRSLGPEHIDHTIIADKNTQPQSSSMIKFLVQKGDSISWTLEIDESSDPLPNNDVISPAVSRQNSLRRPPRKSLDSRARSKSVSTSDVVGHSNDVWSPTYNSTPVVPRRRPRSDPSSAGIVSQSVSDVTQVETISGARPQEAGGEAMISEETSATSSEDESSASSDIARLGMDFGWENTVE
ncbi:hypothetical protein PV325_004759 [Microctonus aethiopoides]|nr:hypothetical protein PV325_004759 [Microctonus aethiopoides]KAK0092266.1 hypothetical protein PV326_001811 [Microctonus aethiopoides]